jgi:hypothetical protein
MDRRYTIACFLSLSALFIFAQSVWLITVPAPDPEISDWLAGYRWKSSIESFGMASILTCCALALWRSSHRAVSWISLLVLIFVAWSYLGQELLAHFGELPKIYKNANRPMRPYFNYSEPLSAIPRLLWHIIIPVSVVFLIRLILRKRSIEQDATSNGDKPPN